MRVQTLSSLRSSGQFMRAGMNMLTTQVNSLADYCGVITGHPIPSNYLVQQQQLHHIQNSSASISNLRQNQIRTMIEDEENTIESSSLINSSDHSPYAGNIPSVVLVNASGIGQLDTADNSVLLALNNFNQNTTDQLDNQDIIRSGKMSGGIGTFHGHNDELVNEPEKLIIYGEQRPVA
jgi:hypothetical protein